MATPLPDEDADRHRLRAALAVLPFLAAGVANAGLVVLYGVDPVWGLLVLPPVFFVSALAWIAFSTDFLEDRTGE